MRCDEVAGEEGRGRGEGEGEKEGKRARKGTGKQPFLPASIAKTQADLFRFSCESGE